MIRCLCPTTPIQKACLHRASLKKGSKKRPEDLPKPKPNADHEQAMKFIEELRYDYYEQGNYLVAAFEGNLEDQSLTRNQYFFQL